MLVKINQTHIYIQDCAEATYNHILTEIKHKRKFEIMVHTEKFIYIHYLQNVLLLKTMEPLNFD